MLYSLEMMLPHPILLSMGPPFSHWPAVAVRSRHEGVHSAAAAPKCASVVPSCTSSILPDWSPEIVQPAFETPPPFWHIEVRSPKCSVKLEVCNLCFLHIKIACHLAARVTGLSFQIDDPTKNQYINHRARSLMEDPKRKQTMGGWFVQKIYTISHCESFWSTCFASKKTEKKQSLKRLSFFHVNRCECQCISMGCRWVRQRVHYVLTPISQ